MVEIFTESAEASSWEHMNSRPTAVENPWDFNKALNMWEAVVKLGLSVGPLAVGQESIPVA